MSTDTLRHIAEQVADCFADAGYAFVEEDKIEGLAAALGSFLTVAGIRVNSPGIIGPAPCRDSSPVGEPIATPTGGITAARTMSP